MPEHNSDGIDRLTGSHGLWRELAEALALLVAGGAFFFVLACVLFSL